LARTSGRESRGDLRELLQRRFQIVRDFGPVREIAEALNARGIATARGGQWHAQSVANDLADILDQATGHR
jgi:hypothetical protein